MSIFFVQLYWAMTVVYLRLHTHIFCPSTIQPQQLLVMKQGI